MTASKWVAMVLIWVLPAAAWAQQPLSPEAKKRIVEHLQSLIAGDPAMLDPIDPVRIEMNVWGNDAITNTVREVPSENVIYLDNDYGRIGTRDRAFLPSGELSDLVINHDFAINGEANWRHSRDKIEISENRGDQYRMTSNLLEVQRNVFRKLLRQGLYFNLDADFQFQHIDGDVDEWSACWLLSGQDREMRVDGAGTQPESIVIRAINYKVLQEDGDGGEWYRSAEFTGHRPIPWRTGQMASEYQLFKPTGELLNRVKIRSLEVLNDEDFAEAIRTPDPQNGGVSLAAESVVDSRGIRSTEWTRQEEGFVEGSSRLKFGKIASYIGVALACVAGVVLAVVFARRK